MTPKFKPPGHIPRPPAKHPATLKHLPPPAAPSDLGDPVAACSEHLFAAYNHLHARAERTKQRTEALNQRLLPEVHVTVSGRPGAGKTTVTNFLGKTLALLGMVVTIDDPEPTTTDGNVNVQLAREASMAGRRVVISTRDALRLLDPNERPYGRPEPRPFTGGTFGEFSPLADVLADQVRRAKEKLDASAAAKAAWDLEYAHFCGAIRTPVPAFEVATHSSEPTRLYAAVFYSGNVLRDATTAATTSGDVSLVEIFHEANLVLVRTPEGIVRRKDLYSSRTGEILSEERADARVTAHVNAALYGVLPTDCVREDA